ncbi:MAG: hypothetical protein E5Y58_02455 [Mesorhizobium sp.]|nr:MAG: hypothetical protein E5Y58_02455 [Mesorhizobium sp.]
MMGQFQMIDLVSVIDACTTDRAAGRLVSMAKAPERAEYRQPRRPGAARTEYAAVGSAGGGTAAGAFSHNP